MMILELIYLATASTALGLVLTFVVLSICYYFGFDISTNSWVLAIPAVVSVCLNIWFIELFRTLKKKRRQKSADTAKKWEHEL